MIIDASMLAITCEDVCCDFPGSKKEGAGPGTGFESGYYVYTNYVGGGGGGGGKPL